MDTRLTATRRLRLLLAATPALALVMALGATSVSAAPPTACRVQNTDTGKTFTSLQTAVDAARKGDRLTVTGTCIGKTVIGTKLVIVGLRTATRGKPTLSGAGRIRVVTITKGVRVRMRSIEIARGSPSKGGGIFNQGTLTLIDVTVRGSEPSYRGAPPRGICTPDGSGCPRAVDNRGTLALTGFSRVHGGVYNEGTLVMNDSATVSRAVGVRNYGTLTMNDSSSIRRNNSDWGGGVHNEGYLVMNDASSIDHNVAQFGGGLDNEGTVVMNDSATISHNRGGGASNTSEALPQTVATLTMNGSSSIHSNEAPFGGGVNNEVTLIMNDASSIHHNVAQWIGGGVHSDGYRPRDPILTMTGSSSIHDNTAGVGGGVNNDGDVNMSGSATIHDNRAVGLPSWEYEPVAGGLWDSGRGTLDGVVCAPQASPNVYANTPDDCYLESP